VREHYHAIVLDHRGDNRCWIIVVHETAVRGTHAARFILKSALDEWGRTTRTKLKLSHSWKNPR
jgi:hypothetical protein